MRANRASAMCDSRARFWKGKRIGVEMIRLLRSYQILGLNRALYRGQALRCFIHSSRRKRALNANGAIMCCYNKALRCGALLQPHQKHGLGVAREHPNIFHIKLSIQHLAGFPQVKLQKHILNGFSSALWNSCPKLGCARQRRGLCSQHER